ncbi:HNH endonuclease signature motif containing protein [Leifsonia sp. NPDC077715]|uniref:HNH endonuclease n=1 Tax=Leifsonia sp. NPDC077715 TaxID=3155539 RepID=UPI00343E5000
MSGWKGSDRRRQLPKDWPAIVMFVLRRDRHRCQRVREDTGKKCGRHANQVDHKIRPADGGTDHPSNLQALCEWHHQRKSSSEGGTASAIARRARRDAAKPLHAGLLDADRSNHPAPF